ncbi:hypothetical protein SAMN04489761_1640 [Tenacibaculum sp. MAR_2009_124]|uniref:hypothetical protein n=1 Tax=Tenacibaculum sp. MAR_2009_124 TaxID=1250059 RepID=UPI000896EEE9|nr:hypothetical protein [Tenacibaculum sp. MAR_2009_124]SEB74532.1 hypothetical protein SAMN04489761_1640 [Tenacibaculum sp. MAR_2009_124]
MIKNTIILVSFLLSLTLSAQEYQTKEDKKIKKFAAFELGQAIVNDFKSYSGEIGVRFKNDHMIRLVHMNIKLTEAHLSSDFASAVEGDHLIGEQFGFEVFYDFPVLWKGVYLSPSLGWYRNFYEHIFLKENLEKSSATIGAAISYRETDVFGLKGLYYTISLPFRTPFNPIKETRLGEAIVKNNILDSNIFLFIGFEF